MTTKWIQSVMPKSVFERAKAMLVFRPEDPTNLWQMPPRFETGSTVERIKGYRYPAPGSQHASVPVRDSEDTVYDIKNFTRHPSHMPLNNETMIAATKPVLSNPVSQFGDRTGSPGNFGNPAVKRYDETGLRSSMSSTWEEMDKAHAELAAPNHLSSTNWEEKQAALDAESERKGIPYVTGSSYRGFNRRPKNYNDVRW